MTETEKRTTTNGKTNNNSGNNKYDPANDINKNYENKKNYGLTTRVALARLHEDIDKVLKEYEEKYAKQSYFKKLCAAFARYDSPLGWFAIASLFMTTIVLLIGAEYATAACLAVILSIDLFIVVRENHLRCTEIYRKTRFALSELKLSEQLCAEWQPCNYPHIWSPVSPCVSLQWTFRDGVLVNLPWALLVRGDQIVLRPGHFPPVKCTEINGKRTFEAHEIYGVAQVPDPPVKPVARGPLPNLICCLQTTPFMENLKIILERALKRPPTIYNQQRYLLVTKYIQQWGFIVTLIVALVASLLRLYGVSPTPDVSENDEQHHWRFVLIESTTATVIPLLPLIFPLLWISTNLWGVARLQCFLKTPELLMIKDSEKSFEEDLDTPTYDYQNIPLMRSSVFKHWLQLWKGDSELLPRSSNLVQVLGSITALCCIDKKGILSWPNPTAEKVFFLHDDDDERMDDRRTSSQSTISTDSDEPIVAVNQNNKDSGIVAEVLDLTHDQHCPFRLEFDDHDWKTHIKSLKPLGLAILLNTCSPQTHSHYAQFCGHVTAVAMLDKDLVPVTNRYAFVESSINSFLHGRCLCELAHLIGFTESATDRFALEGQLASYRHLQPDVVRRDIRFARHLQLSSKVKVPFPHSLSVVMRENPGGYLSLFTQGTADMILDCCDDFWDGKDLRPLSQQDRKRALDFYQRSALTAYCTAFAYRPLRHSIHGALSGMQKNSNGKSPIAYLELPPESKIRMPHADKVHCDFGAVGIEAGVGDAANVRGLPKLSHSISTDSLLFSECKDEDVNGVDSCYEMQCHQVFIGMVTMQYQAQTDIVQLVERLERACIRFVHFSKENELRSRVFSEKMGLESGWNCHISLLSESEDKATTNAGASGGAANNGASNTAAAASNDAKCHENDSAQKRAGGTGHHGANEIDPDAAGLEESDLNCLLPPGNLESSKALSSSAPGAIANEDFGALHENKEQEDVADGTTQKSKKPKDGDDVSTASARDDAPTDDDKTNGDGDKNQNQDQLISSSAAAANQEHRHSQDSALEDNCRSISILTESTEQSAPVHFDMSNRAKLPRGIENIRPHLEQVDNVPLQVSLFTDCSAEATRQMLDIMQSYGEIVVCLGSSASNSNSEVFLQADCSLSVEPLYPQVCQNIPAYTEANIYNNKTRLLKQQKSNEQLNTEEHLLEDGLYGLGMENGSSNGLRSMQSQGSTISPIYLSRLLNSLPCSISILRDDPLSLVAIIELSRRFSSGLWNCIQYWACCAGTLSAINLLCTCISLPAILTPLMVIYLMCLPVPLIAVALAHIEVDPKIMNRATGKKQTEYDSRVLGFVVWCYGSKFFTPIIVMIIAYCAFMAHPIEIIDVDEDTLHINLHIARNFALLGILIHFVLISLSFVHRDHSLWQKNPFSNRIWTVTCFLILLVHTIICTLQVTMNKKAMEAIKEDVWPAIVFLYCGSLISLVVAEICKWQEIKFNTRYQRRARLDFGTKLGMNSPF